MPNPAIEPTASQRAYARFFAAAHRERCCDGLFLAAERIFCEQAMTG